MDWDLKMPPWDLADLEREAEPSLGSVVVGPTAVDVSRPANGLDCSVDLKLGGLGDFGTANKWHHEQPKPCSAASAATVAVSSYWPSPSSASAKRSRSASNGLQNASCAVDGCSEDLSKSKEYNRRHKVCERHSKTAVVIVSGQEQRFCQQCSRFHLLAEFDEVKRSCRKRLDGHNRRRRKAQPDSVDSRSLFPNHQGGRFSTYPQIFPTATSQPSWSGIVKTEESTLYAHRADSQLIERDYYFANSHSYSKDRKQFPFLQETQASLSSNGTLGSSMCQSHLSTISPSGSSSGGSSNRMFSDGLTQVFHSDCALSLLSSPAHTSSINLNHLVPSVDQISPMAQPLASNYQYGGGLTYHHPRSQAAKVGGGSPAGFPCSAMEDEQAAATMLVRDNNLAEFQCLSIFHVAGEGADGASPTLPFSWQ